jgi:hypothetical protein
MRAVVFPERTPSGRIVWSVDAGAAMLAGGFESMGAAIQFARLFGCKPVLVSDEDPTARPPRTVEKD